MKKFHDLYTKKEFNDFRNFIKTEYGIKLVISHFDSYLIYKDHKNVYELKFEVDFDNECASEAAHIINLTMLMKEMIEDTDDVKYFEKDVDVTKIIKSIKMFGKVVSKTEYCNVTFMRRKKDYMTHDIISHEELLKNYELYPA